MRAGESAAEARAGPPAARAAESGPRAPGLSIGAKIYLAGVYALAVGAAGVSIVVGSWDWSVETAAAFGLLLPLTAAAQLFKVDAPKRHSYHATPAFLLAATLLLAPALLVPLVVLAMLPEWLRFRYPWYIQSFNVATYMLNVLAAWAVLHAVPEAGVVVASWRPTVATALAAATFATLNHAMVALVVRLARGIGLRESGILAWESLGTDMALLCVGAGMATLWTLNPLLIALAIAPLFLFYRALFVPQLQEEARYDVKTELLTPRRSLELLAEEIARVQRAPRATSVIMADLDLLRNVNNELGHLAGDEVLKAVAGVLRRSLRGDDVVGRFGGEEFLILLRDADADKALLVAERVRASVEATPIRVADSPEPLRVTISLGVAAFPDPCPDPQRLLYHADLALYCSKLNGRNRVTLAAPALEEGQPGESGHSKALESLVSGLETRGGGFDSQTLRVAALCLALARDLGVAEASPEWRDIEGASLLHDVGKVAIPNEVLNKRRPLTAEDWEHVCKHPEIGWQMLSQIGSLQGAAEIVRAHHERYDGRGYPRGLKGERIPLGARIFAVVDAFQAITSDRPYRAAQSEAAALDEILHERGTQFDPEVVDALLRAMGRRAPAVSDQTMPVTGNGRPMTPSLPVDAG